MKTTLLTTLTMAVFVGGIAPGAHGQELANHIKPISPE
jgi:hypothetical protein